ncbi:MAG: bifunctional 4-hydroxy-2-oxoglutarate aldolase/2-dehydro-3-deoxy-phosphogluconate aldolase [Chloroflexi bacterium]|jgi:2-dehydro-3-deoxyphosphogluconate aldolase/(4S)-4-hydroxy-2-oxoglutarate aldolase|nr:bifunctional 4-hydroxy-2-oxoglutarate aldolase/2-dehydro-3-deoxy-phosphogluconate aldolase [Chloroflexota bacterium]
MPAPDRLMVLRTILDDGAVPTFTAADADTAFDMVAGCVAGGSRVVEFTNRGDDAHAVFVELSRRVRAELPEVILGAGTIIDAPTAALFIAGGARFIVGQSYSEDVARLCNRRRIVYIPGCGSATEIAAAEELGCEIVKLFPAAAYDGPAFVRNFLAPSPGSKVMPTNVLATEEATRAWVAAGTAALGVGGHLYPADLVASRDRAEIAERTRRFLGWIRDARATPR